MGAFNKKIRAFVRTRLIEPMKQMSLFESVSALIVGVLSGVFPVPLTTTVILLLLAKILSFTSAQLVVATTVNVLCSPLQFFMIPLFAQWAAYFTHGDATLYTAGALYSSLEKGYGNFFLSSGSFLARSAAMWCAVSAPVVGALLMLTKRRTNATD